jgi:septal ring factor EnvC (AmiA/AmiB activator)
MTMAVAQRRMSGWTPALIETIFSILGVTMVSIVALGQWQLARQRGWREATESKEQIIRDLQFQLAEARKDRELLAVRMEALEAQVADVQRQNHRLQTQLDKAEARHSRDHGER